MPWRELVHNGAGRNDDTFLLRQTGSFCVHAFARWFPAQDLQVKGRSLVIQQVNTKSHDCTELAVVWLSRQLHLKSSVRSEGWASSWDTGLA